MNRTEEDEGRPILEFLEAVYTKYSTALSRHIAEEAGGDSDSILLAIHSFKLGESHVPQEQTEQKEEPEEVTPPFDEEKEPPHSLYKIIIFYSEKYHAIFGSKDLIKPIFSKIGGKFQFNSNLSRGKGWIFPFNKLEPLELELADRSLAYTIERGPCFKKIEKDDSPPSPSPPSPSPPSPPSPTQPADTKERHVIRLNQFGRHEDPSTHLLFKQIEGVVCTYGVQSPEGDVLPISPELRLLCEEKGYPIAEIGEWEEESTDDDTDNDNDTDNDDSLKDFSESELTDGEDIIEEEDGDEKDTLLERVKK